MKLKTPSTFMLFTIAIVAAVSLHFTLHAKEKPVTATYNGFAVAELFTSEGCSSCPAADAVLAKLSEEFTGNVYVLGFHVDYWNRLGWKDGFSNAAYSKRQQDYGQAFHLNSIYTPQAVINGKAEITGSNEGKLRSIIINELKNTPSVNIELAAKNIDSKTVQPAYKFENATNGLLNIALVQLHAQTSVQNGENGGRILKHINIVRDFKTIAIDKNIQGTIILNLPQGLSAKDCKVIAYLQHADDLQVTAATETNIE